MHQHLPSLRTSLTALSFSLLASLPAHAQLSAPQSDTNNNLSLLRPSSQNPYAGIVKIENSAISYDYRSPWNTGQYGGGHGTGFHIGDNRFLTNAHVVSSAQRLMVTLPNDPTPRPATLQHIAHDCDLALLTLDNPAGAQDLPAFEIGTTPSLDDEVRAVGYPIGGDRMSLTRGVVSRIDYVGYSHSQVDAHLAVQIDAAINPGNSGGPVLLDNKVVGVAFQGLTGGAENTGYMIPPPVIKRFLQDIEDGQYDGYVELGIETFPLLNPAQRQALNLPDDGLGVLVSHITATGSADGSLQQGDVLLSIDNYPIAANGTVIIDNEAVNMAEAVERRFVGDRVQFTVQRNGETIQEEINLRALGSFRLLSTDYDHAPRYSVIAGLVFQPVNRNLLEVIGTSSSLNEAIFLYLQENAFINRPEIVVLTQILPAAVNSGADSFQGGVIQYVGDTPVTTLNQLHQVLQAELQNDEGSEFIELYFLNSPRPLLLRRDQAASAQADILQRYNLSQPANLGTPRSYPTIENSTATPSPKPLQPRNSDQETEPDQDSESDSNNSESADNSPEADAETSTDNQDQPSHRGIDIHDGVITDEEAAIIEAETLVRLTEETDQIRVVLHDADHFQLNLTGERHLNRRQLRRQLAHDQENNRTQVVLYITEIHDAEQTIDAARLINELNYPHVYIRPIPDSRYPIDSADSPEAAPEAATESSETATESS